MPSANRRLVMVLPPMLTFPSCSSIASDILLSRKMKRVSETKTALSDSKCYFEPFSYAAIHLNYTYSIVVHVIKGMN